MTNGHTYITTAIPYVNAAPHLGHALELVQADVLARHRRLRGRPVRFLTGTDDNALKNVTAAAAAGVGVREFVDSNASRFEDLREHLALSFDDFIRTSSDPRHAPGVELLWRDCAAHGDFYRRRYEGLYCAGCEQFYDPVELSDGSCPEHGTAPEQVSEENWFFRLSRYTDDLLAVLDSGQVRIEPTVKRNEVLAFIRSGLADFSVSRPTDRAGGWGIPVPDDPGQVIYVWWDALANYLTALECGTDGAAYRDWWVESADRIHVIGKGILRFHAVYWLALLLSAGRPLPTTIFVHDYVSANGAKISKSAGNAPDPADLAGRYGLDAVRWWLLREVPSVGDTDFTEARLVARNDQDLANGLGNLVNRTLTLVHRYRGGQLRDAAVAEAHGRELTEAVDELPAQIDGHLDAFRFREATAAVCAVVGLGNRVVEAERPWTLAQQEKDGDTEAGRRLDDVLRALVRACRVLAREVTPFLPAGAGRLAAQLGSGSLVGVPVPVFPRLEQTAAIRP